jgi:hypothetical protein
MMRWAVLEIRNAPNGNKVIRKATIVIDWNHTLVNEGWDGPYTFLPGAADALRDFIGLGYQVKVHSCVLHSKDFDEVAPCDNQKRAKNYWYMRDLLDSYRCQAVEIITEVDKPPAVHYIDDKAIHFDGNWRKVVRKVERMVPQKR